MARWPVFLIVTVAIVLLGAGCGEKMLDETNIEDDVEAELGNRGLPGASVVCPDEIVAEEGANFECLVTPEGGTASTANDFYVRVRLTGGDGQFQLSRPEGGK